MSSAGQLFPSQYKKKILVGHEGSLTTLMTKDEPFLAPLACVFLHMGQGVKKFTFSCCFLG